MGYEESLQFSWQFEPGDVFMAETVRDHLKDQGIDAEVERPARTAVVFIPIIIGAAALVVLVRGIWDLHKDVISQGGVIIDTRQSPATVTYMKDWDRRVILVISDKGTEMKEWSGKPADLESLIKNLTAFMKPS